MIKKLKQDTKPQNPELETESWNIIIIKNTEYKIPSN